MKQLSFKIKIEESITNFLPFDIKDSLFFDIETTGLSPRNSMVYLIGIIKYDSQCDDYTVTQYFADSPSSEAEILLQFNNDLKSAKTLVHFNGDTFDIPFVTTRANLLGIEPINVKDSFDIYKTVRPLKNMLHMSSMKQKAIEEFLGIYREDKYDGGTLIEIYRQYVLDKDPVKEDLLLLHNHDDMIGMAKILPILFYSSLLSYTDFSTQYEWNESDNTFTFLLTYPYNFRTKLFISTDNVKATICDNTLKLYIKGYLGELRYYFDNYKDYYYLPKEEKVVHKSVGEFVDKSCREKATKENCYVSKCGVFLPQIDKTFSPCFKTDHKSKSYYFEATDKNLTDNDKLSEYLLSIINTLKKGN